MEGYDFFYWLTLFFILVLIVIGVVFFIDEYYKIPIADEKANSYCIDLGFDQFKEYSRIGILSDEPVAIKCEYAERYSDLGIRKNE